MTSFQSVSNALSELKVPRQYAKIHEYGVTDDTALASLEQWREETLTKLHSLQTLIQQSQAEWSTNQRAEAIFSLCCLSGEDYWNTEPIREQSRELLETICSEEHRLDILEILLQSHLKPIFLSNPHPSLNTTTGRKLPRPAATQDFYEDQPWKETVGVHNVVLWCIRHMKADEYERMWPLVIPPVMTMLDDYQPTYKLQGVQVVSAVLQNVPASLLKRTGIDTLLRTSLAKCFVNLRDRDSPALVSSGVTTTLALTKLTTSIGSIECFDQLCALLGDGLIGTVWHYGFDDHDSVLSSIRVLPQLIGNLGLGTTRYLKALVRQLIHPLLPPGGYPLELQIASLQALDVLIDVCELRIPFWKGHILRGVCSSWVYAEDDELKENLKGTCGKLVRACPSVKQDLEKLVEMDRTMFEGLVNSEDPGPLSGEQGDTKEGLVS